MRRLVSLGAALLAGQSGQAESLTAAEHQALATQTARCWNVDNCAATAGVSVTVGFDLDDAAKPEPDSLRLVTTTGDDAQAIDRAYASARRAILRCGAVGFKLPLEKLAASRNVEVTFNPERMQLR